MLNNLSAEITRSKLSIDHIASELNISPRTLKNKLNGVTEFQRDEMYLLRDKFFPKLGVEYLFYVEPTADEMTEEAMQFEETDIKK